VFDGKLNEKPVRRFTTVYSIKLPLSNAHLWAAMHSNGDHGALSIEIGFSVGAYTLSRPTFHRPTGTARS